MAFFVIIEYGEHFMAKISENIHKYLRACVDELGPISLLFMLPSSRDKDLKELAAFEGCFVGRETPFADLKSD